MKIGVIALVLLSVSLTAFAMPSDFVMNGNANHFMTNEWFTDRSMTSGDIQNFLTTKGSYLANYSEGGISAAQIIYDSANGLNSASTGSAKGISITSATGTISPMAILVMLEIDQGLISNNNPSQSNLDWAMGYVYGNTSYKGFATQVGWGAWQLRYNYEGALRGESWWQTWYPGNTNTWYYPGLTKTIDGYPVTPENAAVSAFYRYTPSLWSAINFYTVKGTYFPEAVPEPTSLVALCGGLFGLYSTTRKKRSR